jgi:hypothetical protein
MSELVPMLALILVRRPRPIAGYDDGALAHPVPHQLRGQALPAGDGPHGVGDLALLGELELRGHTGLPGGARRGGSHPLPVPLARKCL